MVGAAPDEVAYCSYLRFPSFGRTTPWRDGVDEGGGVRLMRVVGAEGKARCRSRSGLVHVKSLHSRVAMAGQGVPSGRALQYQLRMKGD